EEDRVPQRFSVMPWSAEQSRNPEMRHLCGKGCAMQALERFMTPRAAAMENALPEILPMEIEEESDTTSASFL
ncbi:MAG TPA: hypothetical protein VE109_00735, partial [Acidobacteriaceae bacterium]|nr:hypothetical protein [Acidobacteriaceae bacterium]